LLPIGRSPLLNLFNETSIRSGIPTVAMGRPAFQLVQRTPGAAELVIKPVDEDRRVLVGKHHRFKTRILHKLLTGR